MLDGSDINETAKLNTMKQIHRLLSNRKISNLFKEKIRLKEIIKKKKSFTNYPVVMGEIMQG